MLPIYDAFRNMIASRTESFSSIIEYFSDRLAIEQAYDKESEKVAKKYLNSRENDMKMSSTAMNNFQALTLESNADHARFKAALLQAVRDLTELKKTQAVKIKELKEEVKPYARNYQELSQSSIPKAKANYYKKAELEKEIEGGPPSQKMYKIIKDTFDLEHSNSRP